MRGALLVAGATSDAGKSVLTAGLCRWLDIANMGLARAADLPVIVAGDIDRGVAPVITARAAKGLPVLGICGGYQMLSREIDDDVESGAGRVSGLGVLPARVTFGAEKTLGRTAGTACGADVTGYEIRHGIVTPDPGAEPFLDGCRAGAVWGTSWHGTLESDAFRRAFLAEVAALSGREFTPDPDTDFAARREAWLDVLGDLVADHLDTAALRRVITGGPPPGLPAVPPAGSRS